MGQVIVVRSTLVGRDVWESTRNPRGIYFLSISTSYRSEWESRQQEQRWMARQWSGRPICIVGCKGRSPWVYLRPHWPFLSASIEYPESILLMFRGHFYLLCPKDALKDSLSILVGNSLSFLVSKYWIKSFLHYIDKVILIPFITHTYHVPWQWQLIILKVVIFVSHTLKNLFHELCYMHSPLVVKS